MRDHSQRWWRTGASSDRPARANERLRTERHQRRSARSRRPQAPAALARRQHRVTVAPSRPPPMGRYCGRVGKGFTTATLQDLQPRLNRWPRTFPCWATTFPERTPAPHTGSDQSSSARSGSPSGHVKGDDGIPHGAACDQTTTPTASSARPDSPTPCVLRHLARSAPCGPWGRHRPRGRTCATPERDVALSRPSPAIAHPVRRRRDPCLCPASWWATVPREAEIGASPETGAR